MGYFRELPNILYQSPLSHKTSTLDYIAIKNIFRRSKLFDYLKDNVSVFNKYYINDGERPDTIAEELYGDSSLDYIVVLMAGITNIHNEWPIQDFQIYDIALAKYGSEQAMNEIHHYETYEIKDSQDRQILPPNLIVDKDFKLDGSALRFPTNRFTLISQQGNQQLDDKNQYSILVDNIARPVTNYEFFIGENEKNRKIDVLRKGYVQTFINDLRDVVRYERSSSFINGKLAQTENTNITP
tara:strand:+ start:1505 stop:2227 length:723 start_codon:yes stop_codon:yes gene_type:complete